MMSWVVVIVLILHGLIHLMGGVNELGLAKIQGLSEKTLIPLSGSIQSIFGVIWFIAVSLFILSAIGLLIKQQWWKSIAIWAIMISQLLIVIWWPNAKWGTIPNILILVSFCFLL